MTINIKRLTPFQVLDSRGKPTVALTIELHDGSTHTARVPSGASTGKHEAIELRDNQTSQSNKFYSGKSVNSALANINSISNQLVNKDLTLAQIDEMIQKFDGTDNFSKFGANAALAISLCATLASAHASKKSVARFFSPDHELVIPMPMVNILSGGAHANRCMDIQDVLIIPNGAKNFPEAISWISAVREMAAELGKKAGYTTNLVADEGGIAIAFENIASACEFLIKAIEQVGLTAGKDISLALDVAATQFFSATTSGSGTYELKNEKKSFTSIDFAEYLGKLVTNLPIISIEDPFAEDDWNAWQIFTAKYEKKLQIVGDDLFTTNQKRLNKGLTENSANSILIKVNQNGLISSTKSVLDSAKANGFATIVSARSGETEDSWLADLAVGWQAEQIKVGSTHGAERNSKWNRLLQLCAIENTRFANPFQDI